MDTPTFNVLSICSGAGFLDLGIKLAVANARTIGYVEIEAYCCEVLAKRMQEGILDAAPLWSDLKTFDGEPWRGVVDCVVAGIPCQGNSVAGRRQLEQDPRNLWPATRRLLRAVRPSYFFLENPPGIAIPGDDARAPIVGILQDLAIDRWDAEWDLFSAAQMGAPHIRERFFLLANSNRSGSQINERLIENPCTEQQAAERVCRAESDLASNAQSRQQGWWFKLTPHGKKAGDVLWSEAESGICRVSDGCANRNDRLRAGGNGVVPLAAATAFGVLWRRLMD